MSEETFHTTREDVRKLESRDSRAHGGQVPPEAESSALKVCKPTAEFVKGQEN